MLGKKGGDAQHHRMERLQPYWELISHNNASDSPMIVLQDNHVTFDQFSKPGKARLP